MSEDESFEAVINEIESRITPTGLAMHLGFVPKRGWISCPFHEGSKLSMRCDDEDGSFQCRSERCPMHRRRVDLVDFYSHVRDRAFTQAVEELRTLELKAPDLGRAAPGAKGFDTPEALLEFLKKSQPDYEHTKTHLWLSASGTPQKAVHRFDLRSDRAKDREPVLKFQGWLFRKKWFRTCHGKSTEILPYNWARAKTSQRVVIARDEEEADLVHGSGFSAVALSSVGIWECPNADLFIGKDVVLLMDPGAPGREYLAKARSDLMKTAESLRALKIPMSELSAIPLDQLQELIDIADDVIRPWPQPQCLISSFELIPDFKGEDMLPESLRYHLEEQAEELQVPLSSLAAPSIAGLAALVGEKVTVQPKRHNPAFRVAAPTWCMFVADPGQKKTQVLKVALEPLLTIEKRLSKENQALVAERCAEMKALALRERDLEGRLGLAQKSGDNETSDAIMRDLAQLHLQRTDVSTKGTKQIIVREATPEKLLEILVQNPNGIVQLADEIPGWWRSLKTSHVDMRKMFLEGWGGFEILLQRKNYTLAGRSILSVIGGAQCDWVQRVVEDIKAGKDNDGLLHRFGLLINHEPPLERWKLVHKPRNEKAREFYHGIFEALHDMTTDDIIPGYSEGCSNALCFSVKAEEVFFKWLEAKENEIREEGFPRILAAHLSKYTSLFASLSLVFHLVLYFEGAGADPAEISEHAAILAEKWCDYLSAHAKRTFLDLKSHPLAVRTLVKLIRERKVRDRTPLAEVLAGSYKHLPNETVLRQALNYLADRQILRVDRHRNSGIIKLNPIALREAGIAQS